MTKECIHDVHAFAAKIGLKEEQFRMNAWWYVHVTSVTNEVHTTGSEEVRTDHVIPLAAVLRIYS